MGEVDEHFRRRNILISLISYISRQRQSINERDTNVNALPGYIILSGSIRIPGLVSIILVYHHPFSASRMTSTWLDQPQKTIPNPSSKMSNAKCSLLSNLPRL